MTLGEKYGKVALESAEKLIGIKIENKKMIINIWEKECENLEMSEKSQKKGCPKTAFRGLCEAGLIKGIKVNYNSEETLNGKYAIEAVNILKDNTQKIKEKELWKKVMKKFNKDISSNYQMDVVLALYRMEKLNFIL